MPIYHVNRDVILAESDNGLRRREGGAITTGEMVFIQTPGELIPLNTEARILDPYLWLPHLELLLANGDLSEVGNPEPAVGSDFGSLQLNPEARGLEPGAIRFSVTDGVEVLRFESDGKILVQGRLVETDTEVLAAFRWFLQQVGLSKGHGEAKPLGILPGYKMPRYALGQRVYWDKEAGRGGGVLIMVRARDPDRRDDSWASGVIVAAYKDLDAVREIHYGTTYAGGHNFEGNQVIYHVLRDDMALCLVPESVVTPVVPTALPRQERPTVWERIDDPQSD